jgi:hypothetical protein
VYNVHIVILFTPSSRKEIPPPFFHPSPRPFLSPGGYSALQGLVPGAAANSKQDFSATTIYIKSAAEVFCLAQPKIFNNVSGKINFFLSFFPFCSTH